jgi:hypothetical protein
MFWSFLLLFFPHHLLARILSNILGPFFSVWLVSEVYFFFLLSSACFLPIEIMVFFLVLGGAGRKTALSLFFRLPDVVLYVMMISSNHIHLFDFIVLSGFFYPFFVCKIFRKV